jgi:hypothetical protein
MNYSVSQGNRRNDPRPLYRVRNIQLKPGVLLTVSENHAVGATLEAGWRREDDEIGYYTVDFSRILRLRGLGTSDYVQVSSQDRTQLSRSLKLSGEYHGSFGRYELLLTFAKATERDTVFDGIADPDSAGSFFRRTLSANAVFQYSGDQQSMRLQLLHRTANGYGVDPVYLLTNYLIRDEEYLISGTWWLGHRIEDSPFGGGVRYGKQLIGQKNITAKTEWNIERTVAALSLFTRNDLIPGTTCFTSLECEMPVELSGSYVSLRPTTLTSVLVRPDYDVHGTRYIRYVLHFGIDFPLAPERGIMNSLTLQYQYRTAKGNYETGQEIGTRTISALRWDIHF